MPVRVPGVTEPAVWVPSNGFVAIEGAVMVKASGVMAPAAVPLAKV